MPADWDVSPTQVYRKTPSGEADRHEGGRHNLLHGWECCLDLICVELRSIFRIVGPCDG